MYAPGECRRHSQTPCSVRYPQELRFILQLCEDDVNTPGAGARCIYLLTLGVAPQHQRVGLAQRLVHELLNTAWRERWGFCVVWLDSLVQVAKVERMGMN